MIAGLRRRHRVLWTALPLLGLPLATWSVLAAKPVPTIEAAALPAPDPALDPEGGSLSTARLALWQGESFFLATSGEGNTVMWAAVGPRSDVEKLAITPRIVLAERFEIGADLPADAIVLGAVNEFHRVPQDLAPSVTRCVGIWDTTRRRVVTARALDPLALDAEGCS